MRGPKKLPVEVVERAQAALSKQYTIAPASSPALPSPPKKKAAREKVVAALKKLHPMD